MAIAIIANNKCCYIRGKACPAKSIKMRSLPCYKKQELASSSLLKNGGTYIQFEAS